MGPIRILIADDHEAVRRGLRSLLASRADWIVCGEAVNGLEAVDKAKSLRPDVVLMDISMPRMDGVEATRIIRREVPESDVIIVSQNDPALVRRQAAEIDASGYVAKSDLGRDLLPTISSIVANRNGNGNTKMSAPSQQTLSAPAGWLAGGGTLGRLIRRFDWSKTPLGPIQHWPQSLRTSVNLMLNSRHPMWIGWGPEMTFLYNDAYISVLSLAKHPKSLGRPASEVWAEIWDVCGPLADKVFLNGEATFADDVRLFMSRGDFLEETYYSFSYSPIHDESGSVGGLFCPSTETTAKVLNARRLRTLSELSAKALVEKTTDAACASSLRTFAKNPDDIPFALLYLLDGDGKYVRVESDTGMSTHVAGIFPAEIPADEQSPLSQAWRMDELVRTSQPQVVSVDYLDSIFLGPAGQPVREAIVMPVTSRGQEKPIGALIAGVNPTRKLDTEYRTFFTLVADQVATVIQNARASEEEKKRVDALAEIDRARTVFFSNVSHEFRTPLTLMLGPLEDLLARNQPGSRSEERTQLEVIHRNSLRLLKLVNTLLDFSRIEAGRTQALFAETDLATVTAELASVFRAAMEKAGLTFTVDCPPLANPVFIDRDMWEKVVFNLLSNAFKFTPKGEVRVSLREDAGQAVLSVVDSGTGIPAGELPNVFKRFHRIENPDARTHEGTGIGLALVQELVKMHGGRIEVESQPRRGTSFKVHIPFGKHHLPPEHIGSADRQGPTALRSEAFIEEAMMWIRDDPPQSHQEDSGALPAGAVSGKARPRILLAEDNADLREYVLRLLKASYAVEAVGTGKAALQSATANPPDLILSDVMMPEMNGLELVQELRGDRKFDFIPIILLSARAGEDARVEGLLQGVDDYVVKPFGSRELLARIATHLELASLRKRAAETLEAQVLIRTEELEQRNREVLEQSQQLRELSNRLLQTQDDERRHIARELHDSAGQLLTALGMNLAIVSQQAQNDGELSKTTEDAQQLVQQLSNEIRTMSYLLHPPLLDESGISEALRWYTRGLTERSGLDIKLSIPDHFERLPREMELAIFRIVQECLTNIHRHSGSKSALIRIAHQDESVSVEIQDMGTGIPPEKLAAIQSHGSGVGITGMRERIRPFKGSMRVHSSASGTRISFTFPLENLTQNS